MVSVLALSVTFGASSPKGRAFGRTVKHKQNEKAYFYEKGIAL